MSALQQLQSVVSTGRTQSNFHGAVDGLIDRGKDEGLLRKV